MIGFLRITNQRGRRGMCENISRVENLKTGFSIPEDYTDKSYAQVPQVIEKPTEVEYRPIPEIDRK